MKDIVKKIRHNLDALSAAEPVKTTMIGPRKGNEGAFRVSNKMIKINNILVNDEGNSKTMPILNDFLKFAKIKFGGDIPIAETDVDSNTPQALSDVMGLLRKAHEKLEEVKQPDVVDDELLEFKKKMDVFFGKDNLRESEDSSNEGKCVGKKTKLSSRTDDSDEEDSDEGKPVRKKTKTRSRSTKDTTKKGSKRKGI